MLRRRWRGKRRGDKALTLTHSHSKECASARSRDSRGGVRTGSGLQPSAAAKEVIVVPGQRAAAARPGPRGGQLLRPGQVPLSPRQVAQRYAHPTPEILLGNDSNARPSWEVNLQEEADDVIDLGAPRRVRRPREPHPAPIRRTLLPNPRLYPGPKLKPTKTKAQPRRAESGRLRRRKRVLRPVPNSRLYRPGPPRPPVAPPPPARPRAAWPPPPPPARSLDTASRAALRLQQPPSAPPPSPPALRRPSPPPRSPSPVPLEHHLVVTLPEAAARYRPASEHFRARAAPLPPDSGESTPPAARVSHPPPRATVMDAAADRHSASPEDRSEGNETLSAPSEFLAEFLSSIMRRQYVEALKYCRLILQYEPHNSTARGFYPLLRHKVARAARSEVDQAEGGDSSDDEVGAAAAGGTGGGSPQPRPKVSHSRKEEVMEHSAESGGESEESEASAASERSAASEASAAGDHSSLEMDSSDAQRSEPSVSLSRRTDRSDRTHRTDDSASDVRWESSGSASRSDDAAEPDDNGNAAPIAPSRPHRTPLLPDDLENDNASTAAGGEPHLSSRLKSDSLASLRRLRAQFACSIK